MYKAVVMGSSSGGVRALQSILSSLKKGFPLPIMIVQHLGPEPSSLLSSILSASTDLTVKEAEDKEPIQKGFVYVAPPNYHFLVERDKTASLSVDEKESYSRPSIDVLFESTVEAYGSELICVVLSGASSDGARGAKAIREKGGMVIVEDPQTAESSTMPEAARELAHPQYVLPNTKIGALLDTLVISKGRI